MAFLNRRPARRGLALVELALVLPVLILLLFGVMEYGWMFLKLQEVTNTARMGARRSVIPDATNAEIDGIIAARMTALGMGDSGYTVQTLPIDITVADRGEPVMLTVIVPYEAIELLGMSIFPVPAQLRASVTMAKEGT